MTFRSSLALIALLAAAGLALTGCFPPPAGPADEEKEPYFRKGEELAASQDIPGAVEAFEKALEVNPHNSLAHYRLGLLYEKEDPATAMYHFNCFLKRSRDPALSERARERVTACRTALAQTVALSMTPGLEKLQREVERLTLTNRDLALRLEGWEKWAAKNRQQPPSRPESAPPSPSTSAPPRLVERPVTPDAPPQRDATSPPEQQAANRTHKVRSGETPTSIAKKYGISTSALQRANPRLEPRRMRPGDTLVIPPR